MFMNLLILINYTAWYIFIFIAVAWLLVLFTNRYEFSNKEQKRPKRLPTVSVLIPAYNEEHTIEKAISSVLNLEYPKRKIEVIVINDASTDKTENLARKFKGVKIISNRINRGKAYSLNKALKIAKGEVIACIDADSTVKKDALMRMIKYLEDPKVAAVTPALKVSKPKNFIEKIQSAEYLLNIFLRKCLSIIDSVHVTPGVFSIYRKSVLREVGGFDEKSLTEDMEIALRIHDAGYKIENELGALSYTLCPSTFRSLFKQRLRWYRGAVQNTIKYKHMLFNPKYGNLGIFLLPMNFISVIAAMAVFFTLIWNTANTLAKLIWHLSLIDWNITVFLNNFNFDLNYLTLNIISTSSMLMLVSIGIGCGILYKSFSMMRESVNANKPGYILYLLFYPFIMMFIWTVALIYEVLGFERKW